MNWEELASLMYESLYPKDSSLEDWEKARIRKISGKNVLKLAEEYKVVFGRNNLDNFIERSINDANFFPSEIHESLLKLNWRDVFTTNYDTLLERTTQKISKKRNYKVILNQEDLPGSTYPRIIKLHGSISAIKPYIITEEDYRTYPVKYAPFVNTVQQAMLETRLCLIGFSGDDPNFLSWVGWLRDNMGENCPQIYLCNLFRGMHEAERKTLESQNVIVVNLESFLEEGAQNPYENALSNFILELNRPLEKETPAYKLLEYPNNNQQVDEDYYDKLLKCITSINNDYSQHIIVPWEVVGGMADKLKRHFEIICNTDDTEKRIKVLAILINLLRKMCIPLYDQQALALERIINGRSLALNSPSSSLWLTIYMYLLEMYRLDGRFSDYEKLMTLIDVKNLQNIGGLRQELYIEYSKFYIACFDYKAAEKILIELETVDSVKIMIMKACLYSQLGKIKEANDILNVANSELAQQKNSIAINAELYSFLQVCSRSFTRNFITNYDYSIEDGSFDVIENLNKLKKELFESEWQIKSDNYGTIDSYGINSYINRTGIGNNKYVENAFKYILFIDRYCLPFRFSDQVDGIFVSVNLLSGTSKSEYWRWSTIVRTNNPKIIDKYFTRERVVKADTLIINTMFDSMMKVCSSFESNVIYNQTIQFCTLEVYVDVLTRLAVVVDEERIKCLLEWVYSNLEFLDKQIKNPIRAIMNILDDSITKGVFLEHIPKILKAPIISTPYAFYFLDLKFKQVEFVVDQESIDRIKLCLQSEDSKERDTGICMLVLINSFELNCKSFAELIDILWDKTNQNGFPQCGLFTEALWENNLISRNVDFNEIVSQYISKPNFVRCVIGNGITGYANVDSTINAYTSIVYKFSSFGTEATYCHCWNVELVIRLLAYLVDYINNEKTLLEYDLFSSALSAKRRFSRLGDLATIVLTECLIKDKKTEMVVDEAEKMLSVLKKLEIPCNNLEFILRYIRAQSFNFIDEIKISFLSITRETITQTMFSLDTYIVLDEHDIIEASYGEIIELIKVIKYMNLIKAQEIFSQLFFVLKRKHFLSSEIAEIIFRELLICYNVFKSDITDVSKKHINTLYNLSNVAWRYAERLNEYQIKLPDSFDAFTHEIRQSRLNEVKNIWLDYGLAE